LQNLRGVLIVSLSVVVSTYKIYLIVRLCSKVLLIAIDEIPDVYSSCSWVRVCKTGPMSPLGGHGSCSLGTTCRGRAEAEAKTRCFYRWARGHKWRVFWRASRLM